MKKLPIGIQTFSEIRTENYCYVDKTPLIHQLANSGKYYFLARPRRFGKSLLISTLAAAYSAQKQLFTDLYLYSHWDWETEYPVIHISLGRGVVESRAVLDQRLMILLSETAATYQFTLNNRSVPDCFAELIQRLNQQYQQKVVVLIDEYDKPILDNIDQPVIAAEIREGLKNFYSVIKDSDAHIKLAFLTGVSKFSKVSLFSGLNNLEDLTLSPAYATLCGYTETELQQVFADYLPEILDQLRQWYNGYNFLGEPVYNPYDVLLYLKNRVFKNYWFETGSPSFLIKLIQKKCYPVPQLEQLVATDTLLGGFDIEHIELETLLFQTGYLTIKSSESLGGQTFYQLTYPNREVKSSLTGALLGLLTQVPGQNVRHQQTVYQALTSGDLEQLRAVFQAFFASIPHDWYRKNQLAGYEGYYASIVYCYFAALGLDVIAEDSTHWGQIDLTVKLGQRVFIIEFKVVETAQASGQALQQIHDKYYAQKYSGNDFEVILIGIEFDKHARNIVCFEWERV